MPTAHSVSLEEFCRDKLAELDGNARRRRLVETARLEGGRVVVGDGGGGGVVAAGARTLVDFSSNDALGLARHPRVVAAAQSALAEFGAAAGASRLVTGNHPLFARLEERLAQLHGAEAALVVGSGTLANIGAIPALVGRADLVVADELSHSCLLQGAALSGAALVKVAHNDAGAFASALQERRSAHRRCLVVTESVFSMDGDRAPLDALRALTRAHDAWLLVDDAHGFLVGDAVTGEHADVITGSLSKASASYGGTICGPRALVELLTSRARTLVFSTGLPPSTVAAALAALDVVASDPALAHTPRARAALLCRKLGLPEPASHIVPIVVGSEAAALELMLGLRDDGFCAVAIRPPTVPAGTSRVRLSFSAAHSEDDVERLATALARRWRR